MKTTEYAFPVFGTQGGGLVKWIGCKYVFVEAPPAPMGLSVGDELPEEWSVAPANEAARQEMHDKDNPQNDDWE